MDPQADEKLAEWLLLWEDGRRAGQHLTAATLARDHPELIEELNRRIEALKATYWIDFQIDNPPTAEPDHPPAGGRVLAGRYRLEERVAVGGFAEVWRAFDTELQRTVAVKLPKASQVAFNAEFLAEARRVAQLRHPAIAAVHDVGTDAENSLFIVTEFMEGGSLADRLSHGPVATSLGIRWVIQLASALEYAHRRDLIHRDVKPANILLSHHDDVVLADFGIAQSTQRMGDFAATVGTRRYMAPELLAGGAVTTAADIYSLGVVLHEVLTGVTPGSGDHAAAIHTTGDSGDTPSISPSLPPRIAAVCRRATQRNPAERYVSAAALAVDLQRIGIDLDHHTSRKRLVVALALTSVVAAIALSLLVPRRPSDSRAREAVTSVPVVAPRRLAATLAPQPGSVIVSMMHHRIVDAVPYVVAADGVRVFTEPQSPPVTYIGPSRDGIVCSVTFRFDFSAEVEAATLVATTRCWDFTALGGGGRGAAAVDVSRDGVEWISVVDMMNRSKWGGNWVTDDPLPAEVLGGTSLWLRARLLTEGSPNTSHSVAQFGRNRDHQAQPALGIIATLRGAPARSSTGR